MGEKRKSWSRRLKPSAPLMLLLAIPLISGCSALKLEDACAVFGPISASEGDDPQTIAEIDNHNLKWEAVCE